MKFFKRLKNNRIYKLMQAGNGRNRALLKVLRELEYPDEMIPRALTDLNRVEIKKLARDNGVAAPTLYCVRKGERGNPKARQILAGALGLESDELFPPQADD